MEMELRVKRDSALLKAHALIDWEALSLHLVGSIRGARLNSIY